MKRSHCRSAHLRGQGATQLRASAVCVLFLALAFACDRPPPGRGAGDIESSPNSPFNFRVETVVANLEVPWSIVWAPDGRMFFTERPGRVRVYESGKLRAQPLFVVPDVEPDGESGLMSLALHPDFARNRWLYLAYAYKGAEQSVRIVRYRETSAGLVERKVIIENIPAAQYHAGCRIRFGPDTKLYITTGDATERSLAQQINSLAGKTLRLNDDGDWQPGTNLMFQTEHGPSGFDGPGGGDEVNIVERAKNYGWPLIHHDQTRAGLEAPLLEYSPACAPASGHFYRGTSLPQFRNNYFFGCLRGQRIIRVVLDGRHVVSQEDLLSGKYGRIRDVAEGPDGQLYFSTSNRDGRGEPASDDDRILRIVPAK